MIKTTFKDVGNGDSVLIEWEKNNQQYIGIIDCKKKDSANPIINHLETLINYKIYFIALSHPHYDHYSGLLELLEYIEKKNIRVYRFLHTLNITPYYLNFVSDDAAEKNTLLKILEKIDDLYRKKIILDVGHSSLDYTLNLSDNVKLHCLSPSDEESKAFVDIVNNYSDKNTIHCRNAANLLSTIFKISYLGKCILLTSDSTSMTFIRLLERHLEELNSHSLELGQIPHHGSKKNYVALFWKTIRNQKGCPVAFSVGNNKHGHPSYEVIESLKSLDYEPQFTSILNGALRYYQELSKDSWALINALEDNSENAEVYESMDLAYRLS